MLNGLHWLKPLLTLVTRRCLIKFVRKLWCQDWEVKGKTRVGVAKRVNYRNI